MPDMAPFSLRKAVHRASSEGFSLRRSAQQKPGDGGTTPIEPMKGKGKGGYKVAKKRGR